MKAKTRLIINLTFVIILLSVLATVTLSRYALSSTAESSAKVASIALTSQTSESTTSIDISGVIEDITLPGDKSETYYFDIANFDENGNVSEVAQAYTIYIESTGNLPLDVTFITGLSIDDTGTASGKEETQSLVSSLGMYEGYFPSGEKQTHTYGIYFSWDSENADYSYADMVDVVKLVIKSEQTAIQTES